MDKPDYDFDLAFLESFDSGEIHRDFADQIKKLSPEHRAEVRRVLAQREAQRTSFNGKWYAQFLQDN